MNERVFFFFDNGQNNCSAWYCSVRKMERSEQRSTIHSATTLMQDDKAIFDKSHVDGSVRQLPFSLIKYRVRTTEYPQNGFCNVNLNYSFEFKSSIEERDHFKINR